MTNESQTIKAVKLINHLKSQVQDLKQMLYEPIAVIGIGCRFPGIHDLTTFWEVLEKGMNTITEVPKERWDIEKWYDENPEAPGKMNSRWGGFLDNIEKFDPEFFGISPREALSIDPQQRILLEITWEALERAGLSEMQLKGSDMGVYIGLASNEYQMRAMSDAEKINAYSLLGTAHSAMVGRLSYFLGLHGPNMPVDTACSSSLVAIHLACQAIRLGECTTAIAGGVNLILEPQGTVYFSKLQALSPTGRCRTFDAAADGYVRSEGGGVVILKRLSKVLEDKDPIFAVIKGSAVNQDGSSQGFTAPNGPAQEAVIAKALRQASLDPAAVDYVETHGTGTPLGDPIEVQALHRAYGKKRSSENPLIIGSVKSNFGHTEGAAGVAGLIKAILSLQKQLIPPSLCSENLNRHISWESINVRVSKKLNPWSNSDGKSRIAAVSSFGFSGTNAHMILEESPEIAASRTLSYPISLLLLPLSAQTPKALSDLIHAYNIYFKNQLDQSVVRDRLANICYTAQCGRTHFKYRAAFIGASHAEMIQRLSQWNSETVILPAKTGKDIIFTAGDPDSFLPQMGHELFKTQPVFSQALLMCEKEILKTSEFVLTDFLYKEFTADKKQISRLLIEAVVFSIEYALAALWRAWGVRPKAVVGYESYAASCIAGTSSIEENLELILKGQSPYKNDRKKITNQENEIFISLGDNTWEALLTVLSTLYVNQTAIDWDQFNRPNDRRKIASLPTYPFQRRRYWLDRPTLSFEPSDSSKAEKYANWIYTTDLVLKKRFDLSPIIDYAQLAQTLVPVSATALGQLAVYEPVLPYLREISADIVVFAIAQLGWKWKKNQVFSFNDIESELKISEQHRKLFNRFLGILCDSKWLKKKDKGWEVLRTFSSRSSPFERLRALVEDNPLLAGELELLSHCGRHLSDVMSGQLDPLAVLFPENDVSLVRNFYQDSPGAKTMNMLIREAVLNLIALSPAGQGVRILELGAGTGGTTAHLLPALDSESTDYVFTDISPLFVAAAKDRFINYKFMRSQVLDIEKDPMGQGVARGYFDIVIASNVIHATRYLSESLAHIRKLLKPNGSLILLEGVGEAPWSDIIFGVTEGWWRFEDRDLRKNYPLISIKTWKDVLSQAGFSEVLTYQEDKNEPLVQQAVILATKKEMQKPSIRSTWLILGEAGKFTENIGSALKKAGDSYMIVSAGDSHIKLGPSRHAINPLSEKEYVELFSKDEIRLCENLKIIHAFSLDPIMSDATILPKDVINLSCQSMLYLTQAILTANLPVMPQLCILTQGAVPSSKGQLTTTALFQSPLSGLAKVLSLEHPELTGSHIDLDPEKTLTTQIDVLCDELLFPDREKQVVFRKNGRHVVELSSAAHNLFSEPMWQKPLKIDANGAYLITGGLTGLGLLAADYLADKGAKHLILLGRRKPQPEVEPQLNALREKDVQLTIEQVDVADRAKLSQLLNTLSSTVPPLRGIIHSAGILQDSPIISQTWERFSKVLSPKVHGAWYLHELTQSFPLDFFILFSSAAALLGSPGQSNHSAANTFLDALAHHRQRLGLPALSINWSVWSKIGAAVQLKADENMKRFGINSISPEIGRDLFTNLFSSLMPQIGVMPIDWAVFSSRWPNFHENAFFSRFKNLNPSSGGNSVVDEERRKLIVQIKQAEADQIKSLLLTYLKLSLAGIFRSSPDQIDESSPIQSMGLDSLMAVELRNLIRGELDRDIQMAMLMESLTISDLADHLTNQTNKTEAVVSKPIHQVEALLSSIELLSDQEIEKLLKEKI